MALFTRVKIWVGGEILYAADLNGEFDNLLAGFTPNKIDGASATVTAMRAKVDPGENGTESLSGDLLGEIQRLRYSINDIKSDPNTTNWYPTPTIRLNDLSGQGLNNVTVKTDGTDPGIGGIVYTAAPVASAFTTGPIVVGGGSGSASVGLIANPTEWQFTLTTRGRPIEIGFSIMDPTATLPIGHELNSAAIWSFVSSSSNVGIVNDMVMTMNIGFVVEQPLTTDAYFMPPMLANNRNNNYFQSRVAPFNAGPILVGDTSYLQDNFAARKLVIPGLAAGTYTFRVKLKMYTTYTNFNASAQSMTLATTIDGIKVFAKEI